MRLAQFQSLKVTRHETEKLSVVMMADNFLSTTDNADNPDASELGDSSNASKSAWEAAEKSGGAKFPISGVTASARQTARCMSSRTQTHATNARRFAGT